MSDACCPGVGPERSSRCCEGLAFCCLQLPSDQEARAWAMCHGATRSAGQTSSANGPWVTLGELLHLCSVPLLVKSFPSLWKSLGLIMRAVLKASNPRIKKGLGQFVGWDLCSELARSRCRTQSGLQGVALPGALALALHRGLLVTGCGFLTLSSA